MEELKRLIKRYPVLEKCEKDIYNAYIEIKNTYEKNGKLLVCGNGGSAADSDHIVGELMKGFRKKRPLEEKEREKLGELADHLQQAMPAISLTGHAALSTAFLNDVDPEMVFAQQIYGYGKEGDVLLAITTSGNSVNVINAVKVAKAKGLKAVGLTAGNGGILRKEADVCICVPGECTADIQEFHLPVYHALCGMLEDAFFDM